MNNYENKWICGIAVKKKQNQNTLITFKDQVGFFPNKLEKDVSFILPYMTLHILNSKKSKPEKSK